MHKRDKIHIRPMLAKDITFVADLERSVFFHPWKKHDFMAELHIPKAFCRIAEKDQEFLGYLCARQLADGTEILKIASHPNYRNQGIATLLMEEAARKTSLSEWPVLFLEVACSNTTALSFYRNQGFISNGIRKKYYPDGTDAMNMMKHL